MNNTRIQKLLITFSFLSFCFLGCAPYAPRTVPEELITPVVKYSGDIAAVEVGVGNGVEAKIFSSRAPVPDGTMPMMTSSVTPFSRNNLKDTITNTLNASGIFDKIGNKKYLMKATMMKVEVYNGLSQDEHVLWVNYELIDLSEGSTPYHDLIKSHTKLDEFIFSGHIRIPKAVEKSTLDNVKKLIISMHNHLLE